MANSVLAASLAFQYYALGDNSPLDIVAVLLAGGFSNQPQCRSQEQVGKTGTIRGVRGA